MLPDRGIFRRLLIYALVLFTFGNLPLLATPTKAALGSNLVIIDSTLMASIPQEEIGDSLLCIVDGRHDALDQITQSIKRLENASVIRIISHGEDGELRFGGQRIDSAALKARPIQISSWRKHLSADCQILLYGCRVAEKDQGRLFVDQLAALTHANIAASTNPTGASGDTTLEYVVGSVSSGLLADHSDYERAGVTLQLETSGSKLTNWTSNQDGTVTATMEFNLLGRFYYAGGIYSTDGNVYMYLNNREVSRKYINATRDPAKPHQVTFTATFTAPAGNNKISVSPWDGTPVMWPDSPASMVIEAPYYFGAPAAATAHTSAVGSFFSYYYYVAGTAPQTFTATGLPAGLTISSGGVVSGYPRSGSTGVHQVIIRASNGFGTAVLPVTFTITNQAPNFAATSAATLSGGHENTPLTISHATLVAAAGASDPNNTPAAITNGWNLDPISLRIESILEGTLTKGGSPVTAGTTSIAAGENLVWTPLPSVHGTRDAFTIKAYDGALYSSSIKTVKISVGAINDAPTLTSFSGPVTAGMEDSSIQITLADLLTKGDEADIDSAVTGFVVKEITTGSLKIGPSEATATPWNASTNKVITASVNAYWTPDSNANGPQSALKVVARDDGPLESVTPVQTVVSVSPGADPPTLTTIDIISGQTEGEPMELSYTSIAAAADEEDVDGDVISFRIEAVSSGALQKWNGSSWDAIVPTSSLLGAGEKLRWTPGSGNIGLQNAFVIRAWDGQFASTAAVQLKIDASRWTIVPWTAVATSGLDPKYRYTHAYSFGPSGSFTLGGIAFTGVAGGNPSIENKLSTTNFGSFTANDDNNLSDASRSLANDFVYGDNAPQTLTLRGLTPGTRYVLSLFSVGTDSTRRDFTFQGSMGQAAVNQNEFGNNNGIRIDYKYLADSSGSATITIIGGSFNLYGLANRESSPSASLYPPSSLTYDGSPKPFQSCIAPRNDPFVSAGVLHSVVLKSDGTVSAFGTNNEGQTTVPAGLGNVVAVSAGGYHTLALKSNGTVVAWGSNSQGQTSIPAGLSGVVAISAGKVHNLALKSNGTVVAWGSNSGGQVTLPAGLNGIVAVSAGASHSMALKSDGTVIAWGVGFYNYATPPANLTDVIAISAGEWHSLALKSDGTVVAWGNNGSFQTQVPEGLKGVVAISAGTSHSVAVKSDGTVVAWGDRDNYGLTNIPAGLTDVISIDAGSEHSIALKADGTMVSFGWFRYGQKYLPTALGALAGISTGNNHTLAVKPDGTVLAWGRNTYGQTNVPNGLSGVIAVQAGDELSVALKSDKTVVAWGANRGSMPSGLTGIEKIAASAKHVLALKSDGMVVAWGDNTYGQCSVPAGLSNTRAIAAGLFGSLALKGDGTVVFWGDEMSGLSYLPQGLSGVTAISAGTHFGLALKSDGTVVAWGKPNENYWIPPAGLAGVIAIEAGDGHALALKSDGSVVAWGSNVNGEATVPATANGSGVIDLAAGLQNSIALRSDGTIVSWGDHGSGKNNPPASAQFPAVGLAGRSYTFNAAFTYTYQGRGATTYTASAVAPTNAGDYTVTAVGNGASITQNFTINKVTPSISYISRLNAITYGAALNSNHVDSSSSYWWNQGTYTTIPGSKVYSPAVGAILPVGTQTLGVTFLPADSINFNPAVATTTITVSKAAVPAENIALPPLTDLTFNGTAKTHVATAAGISDFTYTYTGRAGTTYGPSTVPPIYAGSYTVTANLNDVSYSGAKSLDFAIGKATPTITSNPSASTISFGQSLASSSLAGGGASVPGVFAFNAPATLPNAGVSNHSVTFTPSDAANYNPVSCTVGVTTRTVAINSGNIAFIYPASLVYSGSSKAFTATASGIPTGFTYSYSGISGTNYGPTSTPPTNAGNYAVTATVTNANFAGNATQTFAITKATPAVTWPTPASINYGTALSSSQLNATASVAGSFIYTPASGATLATGTRTLQAAFTPTDTANYTTTTASIALLVSSSSRPITLIAPPSTYDGNAKSYAVSQMSHLAAGSAHSLAIKADGTVVAWGSNSDGQTNVPANLSGVVQVAAGYDHSLALKADGSVVGWGKNDKCQRTNIQGYFAPFTGYSSLSPLVLEAPEPEITNGIAVAGGGRLSLVLKADGTVAAIGMKDNGSSMPTTQEHALTVPSGLVGVTAIAAGWDHALALKSDGTVVAWDGNQYGESTVPEGLSGVASIAAGQDHSLALKSDGTVVAWGRNHLGQCTVPGSLTGVMAIACGDHESYALKQDGSVVYWGSPGSGQAVSRGSGVIAISAGAGHLLMLKSDGSMIGWGQNASGQTSIPTAVATGPGNFSFSYSYVGRAGTNYEATSIAPTQAGNYTLTVTSTDPNFSSSKTVDFTIAKATSTLTSQPIPAIITEGQSLSAASLEGGSASVSGTFAFSLPSYVPQAGTSTQGVTFTPADSANYLTVTTSVTVLVQGANAATPAITSLPSASAITLGQQLGTSTLSGGGASVPGTFVFASRFIAPNPGPASQSVTFVPDDIANFKAVTFLVPVTVYDGIVSPLNLTLIPPPSLSYDGKAKSFFASKAQFISMGSYHWTAVKSDGTVDARGSVNDLGQTTVPAGLSGVVAVDSGGDATLALKADGTVTAWGDNAYGAAAVPADLTNAVAVSTSGFHSLALRSDGTITAWGDNTHSATILPAGLTNIVAVSAGTRHSLALKSDGTVVAWGSPNTVPSDLSGVVAISAGEGNSMALKSDGTVVAWGDNGDGKSTVPNGLVNVVGISAGRYHSVALKADGTVVAWGRDTVFDPNATSINLVPSTLKDVVAISAGYNQTSALKADGSVVRWGRFFEQGAYRVDGQVYYLNGSAFSVPIATPVAGLQAGFDSSFSYTGRDGTSYAASLTAPTHPGSYRVTATSTISGFPATKVVDFNIGKSRPTILGKPYPSFITHGQTLASYDLSQGGGASVSGTFAFETPDLVPDAGESAQNLVFTPTDSDHYQPVTVLMAVMVRKAKPVMISLPNASTISYGQPLSESTIADGRVSIPNWWWLHTTPLLEGSFTFSTPDAVLPAGSSMQGVTFTPADTTNYTTLQLWVDVVVAPALPSITQMPMASQIALGQPLSSSVLSGGSASVAGSFAWENPNVVPSVGTADQRFVFTPEDTLNYSTSSGTLKVTVNKATATVTRTPSASSISFGQTLAEAALSGGEASIAGSFAWSDPSYAPGVGTSNHAYTFTPDDSGNYATISGSVRLTVDKALASVTLGNLDVAYDGTAKSAWVSTDPPGLNVNVTYNGDSTPPSNAGTYEVLATIDNENYCGTQSQLLVIQKAPITPADFLASQTSSQQVDLDWTPDNSGNSSCTGYRIAYKTSGAVDWTEVSVAADAEGFSFSGLTPATEYQFRIVAIDGSDISSQATTRITTWTALENWRFVNFGTISDSGNAADNANPSGDGMENLIKYALGLSATSSSSSSELNIQMNPERHLELTFMRARDDLNYMVQGSSDLTTWTDLALNPGSVGTGVTVTDSAPAGSPRRFLRLKISR